MMMMMACAGRILALDFTKRDMQNGRKFHLGGKLDLYMLLSPAR